MSDVLRQIDAFTTPGTLLKAARESRGMTAREAADRLHMMPDYVAILERDEYHALRSPAFVRGYLKAYCRLLELDEVDVLALYEHGAPDVPMEPVKRASTQPLQLQRTGLGVVTGLGVLTLMVLVLWWWRGDSEQGIAVKPSVDAAEFGEELKIPGGENR